MHLLRCLHFLCALHSVRVSASHIPGVANVPADTLSYLLPPLRPLRTQPAAVEPGGGRSARLAVKQLEEQAQQLLKAGIAPSTEKTYSTAQKGYLLFCQQLSLPPIPASKDTLILYVTHLAQTRAHSTIKTYLAGVRHLHIKNGLENPLENRPRLDLVLKGVTKAELSPAPSNTSHHAGHQAASRQPPQLRQHHAVGCLLHGVLWLHA